ncbi:glycosyl hydrolase 115 family protein, partial [Edaphobacter sp. HDX4]|uniref:glycosyl hydrolase 115 family protein n=1 Tax=Edaphobacter sp. HDX4 TaxID=2794064 RepID=UPI002FE63E44
MKIPDDVTLGWTDDNYGYLRQLSSAEEQKRSGGSAVYYHVSYWGFPHDYLWLCTTPPALIREEMNKAWDHGARRLWVLNVGDLKPAESDIDYFMQLAWDEPSVSQLSQTDFLKQWLGEQFGSAVAPELAAIMNEYYRLNFVRKPEFMGFNGYNDETNRTEFNPLAWGDQNRERIEAWRHLSDSVEALSESIPADSLAAYDELVAYPVLAAAAQNDKFLWADRSYVDAYFHRPELMLEDHRSSEAAYARVQDLTRAYNQLESGKWEGMMDSAPRARQVFY